MLSKGIIYYTDNEPDERIMKACQLRLNRISYQMDIPIVSVSLAPIDFGDNFVLDLHRGTLTLFKQMLKGISKSVADVIFFCEHDVLYDPSHFEFIPTDNENFFYNTNVWKIRWTDGHAVWTDDLQQTSGICVYRELALQYYSDRLIQMENTGFDRHFEPNPRKNWQSKYPNYDIRHDKNFTRSKWSPTEFRNPKYAQGWKETEMPEVIEYVKSIR